MNKTRLEAFSDGVIAIIITIMVLELRVPHGDGLDALAPLIPKLLCYVLSFTFVGIYWNNHHHLMHAAHHVSGAILWANLHLLFWLSLIPFVTGWMGENRFTRLPVALYGVVMFMSGAAYWLLGRALVAQHGQESVLGRAMGSNRKEMISLASYAAAMPLAFVDERISLALYVAVAAMWLVPDRRIESALG